MTTNMKKKIIMKNKKAKRSKGQNGYRKRTRIPNNGLQKKCELV